jgi:hypothetical protein
MSTKAIGSGLLVVWLLSACAEGTAAPPADEETAWDGTWSGTLTRTWSESVGQSGGGVQSVITQSYEAVVQISSTQVDIGA